jgi:hypothetical protein
MKYIIEKNVKNKNINKKYKVDFSVKAFNKLSEKDEEKIYRIVRIIDSLGEDNVEETSDKDYKFQTDDNDRVLEDCMEENKEKVENHFKDINE